MNNEQYLEQSARTVSNDYEAIKGRLVDEDLIDLLHAGIGLATEAGEFLDAIKKHIFYGKKLDTVNLAEEGGDTLWYLALAFRKLKTTFDKEMQVNIDKLVARYPEKFTEYLAENRDLELERKILEGDK